MSNDFLYYNLSYKIIGICFNVHSKLGCGLPEHCYEHALVMELNKHNIPYTEQKRYIVLYDDIPVGHFFTDLIIDDKIVIELKSDSSITKGHIAQLLNYLKVTGLKVGYVINFGNTRLVFKRLKL